MNRFMAMSPTRGATPQETAYQQPGAASQFYAKAYRFFEQRRVLENTPKSPRRKANEELCLANGFALEHCSGMRRQFGQFRG